VLKRKRRAWLGSCRGGHERGAHQGDEKEGGGARKNYCPVASPKTHPGLPTLARRSSRSLPGWWWPKASRMTFVMPRTLSTFPTARSATDSSHARAGQARRIRVKPTARPWRDSRLGARSRELPHWNSLQPSLTTGLKRRRRKVGLHRVCGLPLLGPAPFSPGLSEDTPKLGIH
jgi:hypothetical protein